jgi:N-acetylglucosamine-6-phosphate deacetylase
VAQAKGPGGTVLMTDAMRAAGLPDGHYELGGQHVAVTSGAARLDTGVLAGSTLTMDAAVRNMVEFAGIPLHAAISMASSTPARLIGLAGRKGRIEPEMDADIVLLDSETLQVRATLVMGETVYQRK